jgi:hypothetical protein
VHPAHRAPSTNATAATSGGSTTLGRDQAYAQIGATVIALVAFAGLGTQILLQRRDARAEWALSYQRTYNDRAFRTIGSKCTGFFDARDGADCVEKIRALQTVEWADDASLPRTPRASEVASASNNDLRYVLGFLETLGLAYNEKKIARDLIEKDIASTAVYFLMDSWWYICWRRGGRLVGESHLYEELEVFVKSVRARRPHLKEIANPKRGLRLLCLPPEDATDDEWTLAGALSTALSERAKHHRGVPEALLSEVEETVAAIERERGTAIARERSPGQSPAPWPPARLAAVIAVPDDIDVRQEDWRSHRARAEAIRVLLTGLTASELSVALSRLKL